ncbi:unnamed protein product [Microthlaspi erraticum]|uniref:Arabidopsis retrotransposon Orf1 C-terminal domain-containing protein n=1 Tax=Microthlaspi erraticum TaxID=1685480 RepID=A0A6D2KVG2_9BRAS|nr:unnamed protein product [Microthlaspi erraticum]
MPFLDHLLTYKITAYNTRHQRGRKLSVGGLITPILCAAGVNPTDRRATEPEEPELDRVESELIELRIELKSGPGSADLGEPECYYFEEYEAPRMNPSVVAAHKRIGLLQKFNKVARESHEKMQKSMDKMVSKIKSLEKKVSGSSSKKKSKAPTFPRSSHSSPPKKAPCPRASQSLFFRAKEKERQHAEKEEEFQGQTLQLDHRTRSIPGLLSELDSLQPLRASTSSTKAKEATPTLKMKKRGEEPQARSSEPNPVEWSAPDGRLPSPDHDLASQFFGGTEVFWSILEHMGHKEHGGTWRMEAAQLDTQRKKGEAILKTSSTVYSTNRSSSSTRPAKLQLDRAGESKSNPKNVASPLTFL